MPNKTAQVAQTSLRAQSKMYSARWLHLNLSSGRLSSTNVEVELVRIKAGGVDGDVELKCGRSNIRRDDLRGIVCEKD
jgi:hypothetical protein